MKKSTTKRILAFALSAVLALITFGQNISMTVHAEGADDFLVTLPSEVEAICNEDLVYFFDSGVWAGNDKLKESNIYKTVASRTNILNGVQDQLYAEGADYGYIKAGSSSFNGNRQSASDDLYSNGWYADKDQKCEYVVRLGAGRYTATGYFAEYWKVTRPMKFYVEYKNDANQTVRSDVTNITISGTDRKTASVNFTISGVAGMAEVHIIAEKDGSSDPVIAGLAVSYNNSINVPSAGSINRTISLNPAKVTKFNDTNGDQMGEFQGWGTSLCWWANRLGYSNNMTNQAAQYFFGDDGLDLNIARYNVGGGDLVDGTSSVKVTANPMADVYDLETAGKKPTYSGSSMRVSNVDFSNASYAFSDADFGFAQGAKSTSFKMVGWINNFGGGVGSGDNLHFTVNAPSTGKYTVKILATLAGDNKRNIGVQVNNNKKYVCQNSTINNAKIAVNGKQGLYIASIYNVELNKGNNTVNVAGDGDWTLDFIKMLVIPSGQEGIVIDNSSVVNQYYHPSHITRSDSAVPGYCVDVIKMDLSKHDISYYSSRFARADATSGYAWNYDWNADYRQVNILKAAAAASGSDFIAEAFSNSPPYFMTNSGCSSGATNAGSDNLRADCVNAFACYMADVIEHLNNENNGVYFQSATGMNEPYTNYWGAKSNKQEGCHFDQGESQSRVIEALNRELKAKGIDIIISASDETSIDTAISSYRALSNKAKGVVTRIDTHTYSGSKRGDLSNLAYSSGENLWMSEVDGSYTAGNNAGEMSAPLGLASQIIKDVQGLDCTAWILWNAVDSNIDANNAFDKNSLAELGFNGNKGYWGVALGDHNNQNIILTKKYYGFGQFTRYIRPGMTIIGSDSSSLAAYDPQNHKVVVVAVNTEGSDKLTRFDMSAFDWIGTDVSAIRTSGALSGGENWADVSGSVAAVDDSNKSFYASLKANSITTYIIDAQYTGGVSTPAIGVPTKVSYPEDVVVNDNISNYSEISISTSMISGSTPWNNTSNTVKYLVDGNVSTFFDGVIDGYAIVDLGKSYNIRAVGYAPRKGFASRTNGGLFYGSNDGKNWELFYEIPTTPAEGVITNAYAPQFKVSNTSYRYVKYTAATGENANLAELKLYTNK